MSEGQPVTLVIWTTSKWKRDDLEGKTVKFQWPAPQNAVVSGKGEFVVSQHKDGRLFIQIVVLSQGRGWAEFISTHFQLPQAAVDRIQRHPEPSVAEFQIV